MGGYGNGYGYGYGYGTSFISCLLDQIHSAKLTSALTADEILQAEDIIEKFGLLIINIEVTIEVLLAEVPTEQCVCLPCCPLPGMETETSNFTVMTNPFSVMGTTLAASM